MPDLILVVNAGSSSVKFALYEHETARLERETSGQMTGIGTRPRLRARDAGGATPVDVEYGRDVLPDFSRAMTRVGAWLREHVGGTVPAAVGHRVALGGPAYAAPCVVDDAVLAGLERLIPLAPLHQPHNLAAIRAIHER